MSFTRAILAAFIGGVLAIVVVLAWRSSKQTGKSIPASLADVPSEAQRLASDVRSRATEAVNTGLGTIREREVAIRERLASLVGAETTETPAASEIAEGL